MTATNPATLTCPATNPPEVDPERLARARRRTRIIEEAKAKEAAYRAGRIAEKRAVMEGR
jgi:hypothetical protein